jgi:hypothetical protein
MHDYQHFKWIPTTSTPAPVALFNPIDNHFWCLVDSSSIAKHLKHIFAEKNYFEIVDFAPYVDYDLDNTVIANWGIVNPTLVFRYHENYFDLLDARMDSSDVNNFYGVDAANIVLEEHPISLDAYQTDFTKQIFYVWSLLVEVYKLDKPELIPLIKLAVDQAISVDDIPQELCNATRLDPTNIEYYKFLNHLGLLYE